MRPCPISLYWNIFCKTRHLTDFFTFIPFNPQIMGTQKNCLYFWQKPMFTLISSINFRIFRTRSHYYFFFVSKMVYFFTLPHIIFHCASHIDTFNNGNCWLLCIFFHIDSHVISSLMEFLAELNRFCSPWYGRCASIRFSNEEKRAASCTSKHKYTHINKLNIVEMHIFRCLQHHFSHS